MKSTINRFLVISVVMIVALAFMNGDCQQASAAKANNEMSGDQPNVEFAVISEGELASRDQENSEESKQIFRFPNVFDIFGSIF